MKSQTKIVGGCCVGESLAGGIFKKSIICTISFVKIAHGKCRLLWVRRTEGVFIDKKQQNGNWRDKKAACTLIAAFNCLFSDCRAITIIGI